MKVQDRAEIIYGALVLYAPQEIKTDFKSLWLEVIKKGLKEIEKKEAQEAATSRTSK